MKRERLRKQIWIVHSTNARDSAFTAYTRREAEETAQKRGYNVTSVESVEEYTTRKNRVTY
jgi:hypothetical protein